MNYSHRFEKNVHLTHHVNDRMRKRDIDLPLLEDLIETGEILWKDGTSAWIHKIYPNRDDNRICAAVVVKENIVVKTVMTNWTWRVNDEHFL